MIPKHSVFTHKLKIMYLKFKIIVHCLKKGLQRRDLRNGNSQQRQKMSELANPAESANLTLEVRNLVISSRNSQGCHFFWVRKLYRVYDPFILIVLVYPRVSLLYIFWRWCRTSDGSAALRQLLRLLQTKKPQICCWLTLQIWEDKTK